MKMDLKTKFKNFFTLNPKSNDGFTLVELIVVIAILGILGGVAVPAYSGYVKKANMGVDETLAGEIKDALILAHYSGKLEPGASVVVSLTDLTVDGGTEDYGTDAAMQAVFGAGYRDSLRLKYDGWAEEMSTLLKPGAMENVQNSTFNGDALGYLLDDVQVVVEALGDFLEGKDVSPALQKYMNDLGLQPGDKVDAANKNAVSNMATMYVADYLTNSENVAEGKDFVTAWGSNQTMDLIKNMQDETYTDMESGNMQKVFPGEALAAGAAEFARIEALANYVDAQTKNTENQTNYVSKLPRETELGGVSGYVDLMNEISAVEQEIMSNRFDLYCSYYGITNPGGTIPQSSADVFDDLKKYSLPAAGADTQASKDANAFLSYMSGLSESVDSLVQDTDINSENYFNDGAVKKYVENYMSMGQLLAGSTEGAFAIYYDGETVVCAPLDY